MYHKNLFSGLTFLTYDVCRYDKSFIRNPIYPIRWNKEKSLKNSNKVENELNAIEQWSQNTNLAFNSKKIKSMLFSTHKMSLNHQLDDEEILTIDFNDQKVERVEQ